MNLKYVKRNRTFDDAHSENAKMEETELVLKLNKDEILDGHVLSPHPELNESIYHYVNQFVGRYSGDTMKVTIMSDEIPDSVQSIIKEVYKLHYEDEYQKITSYLRKRYTKAIILSVISVIAFWGIGYITDLLPGYIINMIGEASIFCLWEVGYTYFDRSNAKDERRKIMRAMGAEIEFQCRKRK